MNNECSPLPEESDPSEYITVDDSQVYMPKNSGIAEPVQTEPYTAKIYPWDDFDFDLVSKYGG